MPGTPLRISWVLSAPRRSMVSRSMTVTDAGVSLMLRPRRLPVSDLRSSTRSRGAACSRTTTSPSTLAAVGAVGEAEAAGVTDWALARGVKAVRMARASRARGRGACSMSVRSKGRPNTVSVPVEKTGMLGEGGGQRNATRCHRGRYGGQLVGMPKLPLPPLPGVA